MEKQNTRNGKPSLSKISLSFSCFLLKILLSAFIKQFILGSCYRYEMLFHKMTISKENYIIISFSHCFTMIYFFRSPTATNLDIMCEVFHILFWSSINCDFIAFNVWSWGYYDESKAKPLYFQLDVLHT